MGFKQFWVTEQKWQKLFGRFSEHENSMAHKTYSLWHELRGRLEIGIQIAVMSYKRIMIHTEKQLNILTTIIDVIFFDNKGLAYQILSW